MSFTFAIPTSTTSTSYYANHYNWENSDAVEKQSHGEDLTMDDPLFYMLSVVG